MTSYPTNMTLRPITAWPHQLTQERRRSNFSALWSDTLNLLDRELWYLGNGHRNAPAVLQIAMREQDFRIDGMPRATVKPEHPGVILNVESRTGPLSFPCDTFTNWQDNLRAIALALEALRKVDRYGVTQTGQQYRGWQAIETKAQTTPERAAVLLIGAAWPGCDIEERAKAIILGEDRDMARNAYRAARRNTHPDRNDGARAMWNRVEEAADVLRDHRYLQDQR
ncbi:molecular chaperone DnaJ [Mycobacteroides chelonae]|uniref:Molecular chaperone DnaJ n=1 Tax=Mycobacteroides chelonae TaxID=1774 RepID=A0A1S1LZC7_MYCCH|nr:molecular chaperone DnaJ [Mycobacteroides chelonae]OHU55951.1 molecular chaperone DnaJ [Mycobacteroides chelonae]OHU75767.1 molecular chaperone DnaJ [Mycobacteroides chelonae]